MTDRTSRTRTAPGPKSKRTPTEFGAWLLAELTRREWLQGDLAHQTGKSHTVVSRWIYSSQPTPDSCERIARAFGIPTSEVLRRAGHPVDEYQPLGDLKQRIMQSVRNIPDPLLVAFAPMLESLARESQQEPALADLRRRLAIWDEDSKA